MMLAIMPVSAARPTISSMKPDEEGNPNFRRNQPCIATNAKPPSRRPARGLRLMRTKRVGSVVLMERFLFRLGWIKLLGKRGERLKREQRFNTHIERLGQL